MKTLAPLVALCALWANTGFGQFARYETITIKPVLYHVDSNSGLRYFGDTNQLTIAEGETAEFISREGQYGSAEFVKDGSRFPARPASITMGTATGVGTTVAGPAKFILSYSSFSDSSTPEPSMATLKITPRFFPPDKTVVVAPGMGDVNVTLESSTNLVHWTEATNGVYGSTNEARFFRIRMQK